MKIYDQGITAIKDHVIVSDMNFGERVSKGGIIKLEADGKVEGIHPRWGQVYSVGPLQKDVKVGEWVLVKHGRWTRGVDIVKLKCVTDCLNRDLIRLAVTHLEETDA